MPRLLGLDRFTFGFQYRLFCFGNTIENDQTFALPTFVFKYKLFCFRNTIENNHKIAPSPISGAGPFYINRFALEIQLKMTKNI